MFAVTSNVYLVECLRVYVRAQNEAYTLASRDSELNSSSHWRTWDESCIIKKKQTTEYINALGLSRISEFSPREIWRYALQESCAVFLAANWNVSPRDEVQRNVCYVGSLHDTSLDGDVFANCRAVRICLQDLAPVELLNNFALSCECQRFVNVFTGNNCI
jgi:hypothetical protein